MTLSVRQGFHEFLCFLVQFGVFFEQIHHRLRPFDFIQQFGVFPGYL